MHLRRLNMPNVSYKPIYTFTPMHLYGTSPGRPYQPACRPHMTPPALQSGHNNTPDKTKHDIIQNRKHKLKFESFILVFAPQLSRHTHRGRSRYGC